MPETFRNDLPKNSQNPIVQLLSSYPTRTCHWVDKVIEIKVCAASKLLEEAVTMLPKLSLFNVTVLCLSTKHQRNHLRYGKGPYLRLCPCAASSLASSRAQGTTFPVCEKVQNILPLIAAYRSYPILTFGRRSRGERSSFVRFKMMYTSNSLCSCFWGRRPARFWRSFVNEFTCAKFSGAARLGFKLKDTYLHKIISDISSCFWSFGFPPGSGGGGSSCLMRSMYYWPGRCCFFAQGR